MKLKCAGGFSYIEIIIALALFIIVIAAVLPTLTQAARNAAYARQGYQAHLYARQIMLRVRDSLAPGASPAIMPENVRFTVWVQAPGGEAVITASADAPPGNVSFPQAGPFSGRTLIKVVVWNEHNYAVSRAIGVV